MDRFPHNYRFLPPDLPTTARAWTALKSWLPINSPVTGIVYARENYGAWIDLRLGFPAPLLIPYIEGLTPKRYQAGDWCHVGSMITAKVSHFADPGCICLWQTRDQPP